MKRMRALALLGILAMTAFSTGCAKLCLIFTNSGGETTATVDFTVTANPGASNEEVIATATLTESDQSICYCLKGSKSRQLQVTADYSDGSGNTTTGLTTPEFTLGKFQTIYVIVDNEDPENPTIRLSSINDTGIPITNCCIPLR